MQGRPGVPQFRMPHGLLLGGLRRLEALFPGFKERLLAEGGVEIDWGQDCDFRDMQVRQALVACCRAGGVLVCTLPPGDQPAAHVSCAGLTPQLTEPPAVR